MPSLAVAINASGAKRGAGVFARSSRQIEGSAGRASKGVHRLNKRLTSTAAVAAKAKMAIGGLVAGFGGMLIVRKATTLIVDFEKTMVTIGAVTRGTDEDLKKLTDTAREMGAQTVFTAKDAGEALLFMARAGLDTN